MKKKYESPELEIEYLLANIDICTYSSLDNGDENDVGEEFPF